MPGTGGFGDDLVVIPADELLGSTDDRLRTGRHRHALRRRRSPRSPSARRTFDGDESARRRPMGAHRSTALRDARRRHRRRRARGAAVHRARHRSGRAAASSTIDASRLEPVRVGPAARGAAVRRRTRPAPRRRAAAEHAAHRDDDRVARRTAASTSSSPEPGRVDRRRRARSAAIDVDDRARPLERRAVPRRRADRRRPRDDHRLARRTPPRSARSSPRSSPASAPRVDRGRPAHRARARARRRRRPRHPRRRPRPVGGRRARAQRSSRSRRSPTARARFTGIGHIRGHETDRLAALVAELNGLGGEVTELDDGLRIEPRTAHGGTVARATHDHRMATTARSSASPSPASRSTTSARPRRPCPQFPELWQRC